MNLPLSHAQAAALVAGAGTSFRYRVNTPPACWSSFLAAGDWLECCILRDPELGALGYTSGNQGFVFALEISSPRIPGRHVLKVFGPELPMPNIVRDRVQYLCNCNLPALTQHFETHKNLFAGSPIFPVEHDFGLAPEPGQKFLGYLMERRNTRRLSEVLQTEALTSVDRLSLGVSLAHAAFLLHAQQLLHRDLCPDNILVDRIQRKERSEPIPEIVLIDFDLFWREGQPSTDPPPDSRARIGHFGFMPPEPSYGGREMDINYDRFALARLLFYILCFLPNRRLDEPIGLNDQQEIDEAAASTGNKVLYYGRSLEVVNSDIAALFGQVMTCDPNRWPAPKTWIDALTTTEKPVFTYCLSPHRLVTDRPCSGLHILTAFANLEEDTARRVAAANFAIHAAHLRNALDGLQSLVEDRRMGFRKLRGAIPNLQRAFRDANSARSITPFRQALKQTRPILDSLMAERRLVPGTTHCRWCGRPVLLPGP